MQCGGREEGGVGGGGGGCSLVVTKEYLYNMCRSVLEEGGRWKLGVVDDIKVMCHRDHKTHSFPPYITTLSSADILSYV